MLTRSPLRWDFTVTRSSQSGLLWSSYTLDTALKLAASGGKVVRSLICSPRNHTFMGLRARMLA